MGSSVVGLRWSVGGRALGRSERRGAGFGRRWDVMSRASSTASAENWVVSISKCSKVRSASKARR